MSGVHVTNRRRRLLVLAGSDAVGGMERVAVTLAREFKDRGWCTRAIFAEGPRREELLAWSRSQGFEAEVHPAVANYMATRGVRSLLDLRSLVASWSPDVVNMHYPGGHISLKEVLSVRSARRGRIIVNAHLPVPWSESGERKRRMTRIASMLCDALVAHSHSMADLLCEAGVPRDKVHIIANGVRVPSHVPERAEARARLGLPVDVPIVMTLARLAPIKGIEDLIEALALVPGGTDPPMLVIAGDGPQRAELEALARSRLGNRCLFLGAVITDPSDIYASADVFALSSRLEGFPMVLLEAAMCGAAAVATSVGGVPESITDGVDGIIVPASDIVALAQAIARLLGDPALRTSMGAAARDKARARFTEARMADGYEEVFTR